ncbi:MAG: ATP synthase subunit I [Acidimicrobiales bacterium]
MSVTTPAVPAPEAPEAAAAPAPPAGPAVAPAPAVEIQLAADMARRSLPAIPLLLGVSAAIWGLPGVASSAYAIALVLANLALSGLILARAARISLPVLLGAALFGYLLRLGLITVAVLAVRHQSWVSIIPLGLTIVVTHLGLLLWETRYVSASLAFPGLKPTAEAR